MGEWEEEGSTWEDRRREGSRYCWNIVPVKGSFVVGDLEDYLLLQTLIHTAPLTRIY